MESRSRARLSEFPAVIPIGPWNRTCRSPFQLEHRCRRGRACPARPAIGGPIGTPGIVVGWRGPRLGDRVRQGRDGLEPQGGAQRFAAFRNYAANGSCGPVQVDRG